MTIGRRRGPLRVLYLMGTGGYGGIERHVQNLIRNLDPRRVWPGVCILMQDGALSRELTADRVPVFIMNANHGHKPRVVQRLLKAMAAFRPHLVHAHEMRLAPLIALYLRPRLPLVQTEHCAIFNPAPLKSRVLWRLAAPRVNRLIGVSDFTRNATLRCAGLPDWKSEVIYNAVDLTHLPAPNREGVRRELGLNDEQPVLGMVGRMADQKDWPLFLRTCARIADMRRDASFVAIGDGPLRSQLENMARDLGLEDRLQWLGFRSDAPWVISGMDILLLTSKHEEMPTTLLEAFAMGTPVAGFIPEGGVREALMLAGARTPALLLETRSASDLASAVVDLLSDENARDSLRRNGQWLIENHFSMRDQACRLMHIYETVVGGSKEVEVG